ncbi:MAG: tripartite tricarboxylate transporter substrate binding protein [Burkholderiales bacterium]|nr:tripartite tricarboxylate transporter substrate binding protein [Burkholderiales bacterium]
MMRRNGSAFPAIAGIALAFFCAGAAAQGYPAKPVRIVVPAAPGGGTDIIARTIAPKLGELLGQTAVIENRAGGSTNIGTEFVARAAPDGYTMLMASTPHAINPSLFAKLTFDPIRDFTPVSHLASTQTVFVVHPALPAKTIREFIALAKSRPGQLTAGTSAGTSQQLAVELFRTMAKIDIVNVPYKGAGAALTDTLAGHVQFQVNTLAATLPHIQSGRLRALGLCGAQRSGVMPGLPTVGETLKGFESAGWYGLLGPAGLPRDIVAKLHATFKTALSDPAIRERLGKQGVDVIAGSPEELAAYLGREIPKWAAVVKASGLKPN